MRGRKPVPTALKALRGNPGNRPLNEDEPRPAESLPTCPEHLGASAQVEWMRMAHELYNLGLLSEIDRAALAAYCVAYGRWVDAERLVQEHGVLVKSPNGYPMQSPVLAIANKAMEQMRAFLTEFGMTPASRTRVTATGKKSGDKDPAEDYFGGPKLRAG